MRLLRFLRLFHAELFGGSLALGLGGCAPQGPVLRYPWFEDYTLELRHELLLVRAQGERVLVGARFAFEPSADAHAAPRDRVLTFPVPPPCGDAERFRAALLDPSGRALPLRTWLGEPDVLPAGDARQTFEIALPARSLEAHGTTLLVTYAQRCAAGFRYTLRTGAYWAGPIGRLDVVVDDPERRVLAASVEGRGPRATHGTSALWSFVDLEPTGGVELTLR